MTIYRRVVLESPYGGNVDRNVTYARDCIADCLKRGEAPIASHLLYTQPGILDDTIPEEHEKGIDAGLSWAKVADYTVVYCDYGITEGMKRGIKAAQDAKKSIYYRTLGENPLDIEVLPPLPPVYTGIRDLRK